ncbi:MAG: 7-dehydrocholesterol reductase, partial [Chlamydiae bacterium]|nr:7-dehydrocholesterol reductase [Chlamydiota bacterium]
MASIQAISRKVLQAKIHFIRRTLFPLFLIVCCPLMVMLMWYTSSQLGGTFQNLGDLCIKQGTFYTFYAIWSPVFFGTPVAWKILSCFAIFELILMRLVPGKIFKGPVTPAGNIPIYKSNGIACFVITYATFYLLSFQFHLFSPTILYDNLGGLLGALCIFSFFFCIFLYIKG